MGKRVNRNLFYLLFALSVLILNGQAPRKFYTKFGGSGIDIGYGVKQTLDGQYIITGSTSSYGYGNTDALLTKMDSMGVIIWQKSLGGFVNDIGRSINQLPDSGFVVSGYSNSFGNGGYDAYVVRTDKYGNVIWQKTWGGMDWDFAQDAILMPDNNIVICGSTQSFGNGKKDAFAVKLNVLNGSVMWQKIIGGAEDDEFKGLTLDNSGNIVSAGYTKSRGDVLGDMWAFTLNPANGDSLGRLMYGSNKADWANDVVVMPDGKTILAGGSEGFTNGKKDACRIWFYPSGQFDFYINDGLATEDEEIFKIIRSNSGFCASIFIYSTKEIAGSKTDIKTAGVNTGGWLVPGGFSGSFGFLEDEEAFDIAPTKDKGTVQVGYTTSFNAINRDVFFVKRDSVLSYGTNLVGLNEIKDEEKATINAYPNPVQNFLTLKNGLSTSHRVTAELCSLEGRLIRVMDAITAEETIDLSNLEAGIYFLRVYSDYYSKTIKIEKL